jgi:hypothetical protein
MRVEKEDAMAWQMVGIAGIHHINFFLILCFFVLSLLLGYCLLHWLGSRTEMGDKLCMLSWPEYLFACVDTPPALSLPQFRRYSMAWPCYERSYKRFACSHEEGPFAPGEGGDGS